MAVQLAAPIIIPLAAYFGVTIPYLEKLANSKGVDLSSREYDPKNLTSYDDLILSVDTLTAKSYSFVNFKNTFTGFDYKIHNIHVVATKNDVFSKLDAVIISSVVDNQFFNKVKTLTKNIIK